MTIFDAHRVGMTFVPLRRKCVFPIIHSFCHGSGEETSRLGARSDTGQPMKTHKWRILLPLTNLVLAVVLAIVAARQYHFIQRTDPDEFYEGNYHYMPVAQAISLCINAPSYVASELLRNLEYTLHVSVFSRVYWFPHDGGPEYYVTLLVFWWCAGWELDRRRNARHAFLNWIESVLGTGFSCVLIWQGVANGVANFHIVQFALLTSGSIILWGLALFGYFGSSLAGLVRSSLKSFHEKAG